MNNDILSRLYQSTEERKTSEEYNKLRTKLEELKEDFLRKIGEDRRQELEKIIDKIYEMDSILSFEDFCNGASITMRYILECVYKERDDQ